MSSNGIASGNIAAVRQSLASFRAEREDQWRAFENLLDKAERKSPRKLTEEELVQLPALYRATLSSLAVARNAVLDAQLLAYLEALSLRGYHYLYGARGQLGPRIGRFFLADWPAAIRSLWRETLVMLAVLVVGIVAGWRLVALDPVWFTAIVGEMAQRRGPDASAAALREILYGGGNFLSGFAAYLFVHNAQIAILAFALGFAFAVPTILLVATNGALMGAMMQVYFAKGLGWQFVGWLAIHGTTELFAIILAGAAGLRIGTAVAFPAELSRTDAASRAGRTAGVAMVGVIVMLLIAGLLEGIGRQTISSDLARYLIGGGMLVGWCGYYYGLRVRPKDEAPQ
jgi:uncharacterized membrane protein SpoIIM required for sporulation